MERTGEVVYALGMPEIRISVVITSMEGRSGLLRQALESIRNQTLRPDEVVLVLEGRDPGWREILENFSGLPLQVARRPAVSGCPGPAKNQALALARGEFLVLLDDDDMAFPERIERQVGFLETHPEVDFVAAPMVYRGGGRTGSVWPDPREAGPLTLERLLGGNRILYSSVTLRRRALEGFPGFPEDREVGEDYWGWLALVARGRRGVLLRDAVGVRRVHGGNVSTPGGTDLEARSVAIAEAFLPFCEDLRAGRRILARRWRNLARRYWREGRPEEARRAFWTAFRYGLRPVDALRALGAGRMPWKGSGRPGQKGPA